MNTKTLSISSVGMLLLVALFCLKFTHEFQSVYTQYLTDTLIAILLLALGERMLAFGMTLPFVVINKLTGRKRAGKSSESVLSKKSLMEYQHFNN